MLFSGWHSCVPHRESRSSTSLVIQTHCRRRKNIINALSTGEIAVLEQQDSLYIPLKLMNMCSSRELYDFFLSSSTKGDIWNNTLVALFYTIIVKGKLSFQWTKSTINVSLKKYIASLLKSHSKKKYIPKYISEARKHISSLFFFFWLNANLDGIAF